MKKTVSFLLLFLPFTLLLSCTTLERRLPRDIASLQMNNGVEGLWFVQGTSSTKGPYNGELELRKLSDGTYQALRVVTYINYFHEGLKVQEVWNGKALAEGDVLFISYDLKQGDFITQLGEQTREASEFKHPINVVERFSPSEKGLATTFTDRKVSNYTEWLTTRRDLEAQPLWINERTTIDAKGPHIPTPVRNTITGFKSKIGYNKDAFVKSFKDRKEFEEEKSTVVFDPTDFRFYRQNKDVIRVVNKITDDISIMESSVKRNAYAPSLDEKQFGFEKNALERHVNELGLISTASVDAKGRLQAYVVDDSTILTTGMYVGSQAMRYLVTKSPEALSNLRKSLKGLFILMDITDDKKNFARALAPYKPGQALPEGWHQGAAPFQNVMWLESDRSDVVKGLTHAFLWASLVIPENEQELWSHLKEKSLHLLDLDVLNEKPEDRATALGLAGLVTKNQNLQSEYLRSYRNLKTSKKTPWNDSAFYWHGNADWNAASLGVINNVTNILIADRIGEAKLRDELRDQLLDSWLIYNPAQRHLLTLATFGFAYSQGARSEHFRAESSDEKYKASLNQAVWGLREIPYPRPSAEIQYDHSLSPEFCLSPIPRLFWRPLQKPTPPAESFYQGLSEYPIFEKGAFDSPLLWQDGAFAYKGSAKGIEFSGVDYLYAYWLARYSQVPNLN